MERRQITYIHLAFWAYMVLQQVFPILTHAKLDPLYYKIVPLDLSFAVILFYILYRLVLRPTQMPVTNSQAIRKKV